MINKNVAALWVHVSARFISPREARTQYHAKKNTQTAVSCIIRVELCCFSDRFFKIDQPTEQVQNNITEKNYFSVFFFLSIVFDRTMVFQITANFRSSIRPMFPRRGSLSRDIFSLSLENLNDSQWDKVECYLIRPISRSKGFSFYQSTLINKYLYYSTSCQFKQSNFNQAQHR